MYYLDILVCSIAMICNTYRILENTCFLCVIHIYIYIYIYIYIEFFFLRIIVVYYKNTGIYFLPTSHSSRIMLGCFWLSIIVVIGSYNSHLVAFLTAPEQNKRPIDSLSVSKVRISIKSVRVHY